jgi:glycosyltransferase involved in cell wall biosynthesis
MDKSDPHVYYSVKLRRNLAESTERVPPGSAHYSYSAVAQKFLSILTALGSTPVELERPEIYVAPPVGTERDSFHLAFKPFDEIRLLKGAFNIAHVAWEFDKLPRRQDWLIGDDRFRNPFADYCHMLKLPERIWVGCAYTQRVLNEHQIHHVDIVPAPLDSIPAQIWTTQSMHQVRSQVARKHLSNMNLIRLDSFLCRDLANSLFSLADVFKESRSIFLVVVNPGDPRKNLPAVLDGFSLAAQENSEVRLIVKLVIDNRHVTLGSVVSDLLPAQYRNFERAMGDVTPTNIYITSNFLSRDQLYALYLCTDFYLAASLAEGQNLPLQEAMAMGTIPVAPHHTAMADYVSAENGIEIDCKLAPAPACFERAYGLRDFRLPVVTSGSIAQAVLNAAGLNDGDRDRKRGAAWKTMKNLYSGEVLGNRIRQLFDSYLR